MVRSGTTMASLQQLVNQDAEQARLAALQQFVNEDAEKARLQGMLVQEFGYNLQEQTPSTKVAPSTTTSATAAGTGGAQKDVKNKFEKPKPRTRTRMISGEEPRRNITQAMEAAADNPREKSR